MFKFLSDETSNNFSWGSLGSTSEGRENLGEEMPVLVYRLFQYTMRDVLNKRFGSQECVEVFRAAGELAGLEFTKNMLDTTLPFDKFVSALQQALKDTKVGILRMEKVDLAAGELLLSVAEDLDCSGLPVTGETICNYDEGFIAGILKAYTGTPFTVREIDCWSKGDRVCRFTAKAGKE